jgi:FkbH-like protein
VIALVGRCGLERLAAALRALGETVAVLPDASPAVLAALEPELVYHDVLDGVLMGPVFAAALVGRDPGPLLDAAAPWIDAQLAATAAWPRLLRGPRRPPFGAFGLGAPIPPALVRVLDRAAAWTAGQRCLDLQGLWARHGIVEDGVLHTLGHGEAELGPRGCSRLSGEPAAVVEARALRALLLGQRGRAVKALAVDLDDTLIYGELADPGFADRNPAWCPEGEAPRGEDERAFWMAPRGLHEALRVAQARGLLLVLVTRNDEALVRRAFRRRPRSAAPCSGWLQDLLLDCSDFLWIEANFGPKSESIRRAAAALGLGLDAFAFFDNSPLERAEVAANAEGVRVMDVPVDAFRELLISGEGLVPRESPSAGLRAASTAARLEVKAAAAAGEAALLRFLAGLELRMVMRPALPGDRPRLEELLLRSHQLRLTGEGSLPPDLSEVWVWSLRDRLADHGLVGIGWFAGSGADLRLVELAMSCRVLPHRVAASALAALRALRPSAAVQWIDTGRNAASAGLIAEAAEAAEGVAGHLRLVVEGEGAP